MAFTPDGNKLACTGGDFDNPPNGYVWDAHSGEVVMRLKEPRREATALAVAPDGETLAVGGEFGIRLWSLTTGQELGLIGALGPPKLGPFLGAPVFLPDGHSLAAACTDKTIRVWDWRTRQLRRTFSSGKVVFFQIASSPDGSLLATWRPGPIQVWETATGKLLRTFGESREGTRTVAFAPDGRRLVVATRKSVDVWDVLTGEELSARDGQPLLSGGHLGDILCAAISPDGKTIASGGADTTILLWDAHDLLPQTPPTTAAAKDLDRLWNDLAAADAPTAYRAVLALLGAPDKAAALVRDRLPPAAKPDPDKVKKLLVALDSDDPTERDDAGKALGRYGEAVEPALRETLAGRPSAEVRSRCERLLEAIAKDEPDADGRRGLRAVQVLEHLGTPEARAALKDLAGGAPGRLSRAAQLALDLLGRP